MATKILPAQVAPTPKTYRLAASARRKLLRGIDVSKTIPADTLREIERQRREFVAKNGDAFGF